MKKNLKYIIVTLFFFTHPGLAKRSPNRLVTAECETPSCKTMKLDLHNLMEAKVALDKSLKNLSRKGPSQAEKVFALQAGKNASFVCSFAFDKASRVERKLFHFFTVKSYELLPDNDIDQLELAQCYRMIWDKHKMEINQYVSTSALKKLFKKVYSTGKPNP